MMVGEKRRTAEKDKSLPVSEGIFVFGGYQRGYQIDVWNRSYSTHLL